MADLTARYAIYDDFLDEDLAGRLLQFALDHEAQFEATKVGQDGEHRVATEYRNSRRYEGKFEQTMRDLRDIYKARFPEFCAAVGLKPYEVAEYEMEMAASGDGDFFIRHVDTFSGKGRNRGRDRMLTTVYYFHRQPKGFSEGNLALYGFVGTEPAALIEPRHNRLLVFPAIAPHEVLPVVCPSQQFADSRFTVNCWFNRGVTAPQ